MPGVGAANGLCKLAAGYVHKVLALSQQAFDSAGVGGFFCLAGRRCRRRNWKQQLVFFQDVAIVILRRNVISGTCTYLQHVCVGVC